MGNTFVVFQFCGMFYVTHVINILWFWPFRKRKKNLISMYKYNIHIDFFKIKYKKVCCIPAENIDIDLYLLSNFQDIFSL